MKVFDPVLLGPPLQGFYRLSLHPYAAERERFQLSIRPDAELVRKGTAYHSLDIQGTDALIAAVSALGASAYSRFLGALATGVPVFEPVPCTPEDIRAHVSDARFQHSDGLTLLVLDVTPAEIDERVQKLKDEQGLSLRTTYAA